MPEPSATKRSASSAEQARERLGQRRRWQNRRSSRRRPGLLVSLGLIVTSAFAGFFFIRGRPRAGVAPARPRLNTSARAPEHTIKGVPPAEVRGVGPRVRTRLQVAPPEVPALQLAAQSPLPTAAPGPGEAEVQRRGPSTEGLLYTGYFSVSGMHTAVVVDKGTGTTHVVRVGDALRDMAVKGISPERVLVERDGVQASLQRSIGDPDVQSRVSAVPAVPSTREPSTPQEWRARFDEWLRIPGERREAAVRGTIPTQWQRLPAGRREALVQEVLDRLERWSKMSPEQRAEDAATNDDSH